MLKNIELNIGERVQLRKAHPCGGLYWSIIRTGADIKLKCERCGHIVMMSREACVRAIKNIEPKL